MEKRLKKIERALSVQKQMHRLAEWQVAALDRERAELAESQVSLLGALNRDQALHGLFVEAMARRLAALARENERLNLARIAMAKRLTEAGLKVKRTERMGGKIRRAVDAAAEKRAFTDLLDLLAKPDKASLP
jgi:hypothetical protein